MKKVAVLVALSLLALLIVLPITSSVNQTVGNPVLDNRSLRADGSPIPLPPKKRSVSSGTLVADGSPIPLPPKKRSVFSGTLVADGSPIPLPPKKLWSAFDSLAVGGRVSA